MKRNNIPATMIKVPEISPPQLREADIAVNKAQLVETFGARASVEEIAELYRENVDDLAGRIGEAISQLGVMTIPTRARVITEEALAVKYHFEKQKDGIYVPR